MDAHFGRDLALDLGEVCPGHGPKADPNLGLGAARCEFSSRLKVLNILDDQETLDFLETLIIHAYGPNGHNLEPFSS